MDKTAFDIGFEAALEKLAKKKADNRPEAGYFARQTAATRALRASDKGIGQVFADPKLIKNRIIKSTTHGAAGAAGGGAAGAAGGALLAALSKGKIKPRQGAGIGAVVGGAAGGLVGNIHVQTKADAEYLKPKGIKHRRMGMDFELDDKAKRRYLSRKYRGGGYKG